MKKKRIIVLIIIVAIIIFSLIFIRNSREDKNIVLGAILPLSGDAAQWGTEAKKAIELGVEEVNSNDGINGEKIRIIFEDSKLDPKEGANAIHKLISADKVRAIIGAISSSVTLAIAPIAESNKVLLISPASTNHQLSDAGDYIFRTIPTDIYEGSFMAEYAYQQLLYKKICIISVNAAGTKSMADAFSSKFSTLGGSIPIYELISQGGKDFRSELVKIQDFDCDAIYVVGFPLETGLVLKQAREIGLEKQFLSAQPAEDPQVREIAGEASNGLIFTTTTVDPDTASNNTKNFIEKFKSRWGKEPGVFSYESYDAFNLIINGIIENGYSSNKLKDYLYKVDNYEGVSGNMSFDEYGDVLKPIRIVRIKNGEFKSLK